MKKGLFYAMLLLIGAAVILKGTELFSPVHQNSASFLKQLKENQRTEGILGDFLDFEFDVMAVFDENVTVEEMEAALKVSGSALKQSEKGMHNIVFVKDGAICAQLYGYDSVRLEIESGIYSYEQALNLSYIQISHVYHFSYKTTQ